MLCKMSDKCGLFCWKKHKKKEWGWEPKWAKSLKNRQVLDKKVAYIYCNPKKITIFAGLLGLNEIEIGRLTPVSINKLKV